MLIVSQEGRYINFSHANITFFVRTAGNVSMPPPQKIMEMNIDMPDYPKGPLFIQRIFSKYLESLQASNIGLAAITKEKG
jgi:hypothetical protein